MKVINQIFMKIITIKSLLWLIISNLIMIDFVIFDNPNKVNSILSDKSLIFDIEILIIMSTCKPVSRIYEGEDEFWLYG